METVTINIKAIDCIVSRANVDIVYLKNGKYYVCTKQRKTISVNLIEFTLAPKLNGGVR